MSRKHEIDHANPFEAFRHLVYAAGVPNLAKLMGLHPGTLYNKADAHPESHAQPTLRDVMLATQLTGDLRVVDALNEMFGRASYDARVHSDVSDSALLELLTGLGIENGDFNQSLHDALMDKRIDPFEIMRIRATAFDLIAALMTVVTRVEGLVDGE